VVGLSSAEDRRSLPPRRSCGEARLREHPRRPLPLLYPLPEESARLALTLSFPSTISAGQALVLPGRRPTTRTMSATGPGKSPRDAEHRPPISPAP
jgi:hypothetical protein